MWNRSSMLTIITQCVYSKSERNLHTCVRSQYINKVSKAKQSISLSRTKIYVHIHEIFSHYFSCWNHLNYFLREPDWRKALLYLLSNKDLLLLLLRASLFYPQFLKFILFSLKWTIVFNVIFGNRCILSRPLTSTKALIKYLNKYKSINSTVIKNL